MAEPEPATADLAPPPPLPLPPPPPSEHHYIPPFHLSLPTPPPTEVADSQAPAPVSALDIQPLAPVTQPVPARRPPPPPPPTLPQNVSTVAKVDRFIVHLERCMQTPSGVDTVLLLLCYTSRLSASLLEKVPALALSYSAVPSVLGRLSSSLPVRGLPGVIPTAATIKSLALRLRALSTLTSDARTFTRLWGILGLYLWARRLATAAREAKGEAGEESAAAAGSRRRLTAAAAAAWTQLIACVAFQVLENGAYLAGKKILGWRAETQAKASLWSTRFWAAYVGLELGRLLAERLRRKSADGEDDGSAAKEDERWRLDFASNLAWAPLTIHWSLEGGLMGETALGALACVPGIIQIRQLWRQTAGKV